MNVLLIFKTLFNQTQYILPNLFPVIIPVPTFPGVANGKCDVMRAFRFSVQRGVLEYVFNSLLTVAAQPEPQALAETEIFPAFILPAVPVIIHALQFRIGIKSLL